MKKSYLFLVLLAALSFSCSNDDDKPADEPVVIVPEEGEQPGEEQPAECLYYNGDAILTTQAEVDAFGANHYCGVMGNFYIGSQNGVSNITSLEPLKDIVTATGTGFTFTIKNNPNLVLLEGLHNIANVSKVLIENNASLLNLQGLRALTNFDEYGTLRINNNASLQNLNGLEAVTKMRELLVTNNPALISCIGLKNCTEFGQLTISSSPQLATLNGITAATIGDLSLKDLGVASLSVLNGLTEADYISIEFLPNLTTLQGLEGLISVSGVSVRNNAGLTSLYGLQNLTGNVNSLVIEGNNAIVSVEHLLSVTSITNTLNGTNYLGGLTLRNNASLISLNGLQNVAQFSGNLYITQNNALKNLCALQSILINKTSNSYVSVYDNLNPVTPTDIIAGNCSID